MVLKQRIEQFPLQEPDVPHDYEAEETLLGAVLVSPEQMALCRDLVQPGDFHRTHNGNVWAACCQLHDRNEPVNPISVAIVLKGLEQLQDAPLSFLTELTAKLPQPDGADWYAGIIREKKQRRDLIAAAGQLVKEAYSGSTEVPRLVSEHERRLQGILTEVGDRGLRSLADVFDQHYGAIRGRLENPRSLGGISTGYRSLDRIIDGLKPQIYVMGGAPFTGKTLVAAHIAEHVALSGQHVAFFSLEMAEEPIVQRMLFKDARIDFGEILRRKDGATAGEFEALDNAKLRLEEAPFWLCDRRGMEPSQIRRQLRQVARQHPLGLVVFDYLHLMRIDNVERRNEQLKKLMDHMREYAQEFNCAVLVLSQLSREGAFYESAAIEQQGDTLMSLIPVTHKTGQAGEEVPDPNRITLVVSKNKSGVQAETGKVPLWIDHRYGLVTEVEQVR
jgi:replicative DNA helicase